MFSPIRKIIPSFYSHGVHTLKRSQSLCIMLGYSECPPQLLHAASSQDVEIDQKLTGQCPMADLIKQLLKTAPPHA